MLTRIVGQFEAIVELAAAFLQGSSQSDESLIDARWKSSGVFISAPSATLSFSLGIVDPLYEVCARCRDPALRRRALDLLAKHPRQECVWSSWSAWKVGKFIMRLEEEGSPTPPKEASDVPAAQRISEAWLDFSLKRVEGSPLVGYRKAVPRASARYALNPGLFDLEADSSAFTQFTESEAPGAADAYASPPHSSARQGSYDSESSAGTFNRSRCRQACDGYPWAYLVHQVRLSSALAIVLDSTVPQHQHTLSARRVASAQPWRTIRADCAKRPTGPLILVDLAWATHTWQKRCSVGAGRSSSVAPLDERSGYTGLPECLWVCPGIVGLVEALLTH